MTYSKNYTELSVFTPENLLREARRQKNIKKGNIPPICVLDPDGDLVSFLIREGKAQKNKSWACYHTILHTVDIEDITFGIIGCAVGASFAVLLAEQLFVSGCELLISITSAGKIDENEPRNHTQFVIINDSLRDEGTSHHYLPPDENAEIAKDLLEKLVAYFEENPFSISIGKSWTTDAPYRETSSAIAWARAQNAICVEMEAAALYAFGKAKKKNVICVAHLTNAMAIRELDFEKGEEMGSFANIALLKHIIKAMQIQTNEPLKAHWETVYTTKNANEVSWTQEIPQTSLQFLHSFGLNKDAKIIDVGGGDSRFVDYLLSEGFKNITVLDISASALEKSKKHLGRKAKNVQWIVSNVIGYETEEKYDFWHDRATFHFLTTEIQIEKYLEITKRAVCEQGFLVVGTFSETGPQKCSGLDVKQYSQNSLAQRFEISFEKLRCLAEDHQTPFGTLQNFTFCSFKKAK
jgi:purine-nucleoside phosphorylase/ubiquinone/menaquinone biosynthesis C-methylase UbiE